MNFLVISRSESAEPSLVWPDTIHRTHLDGYQHLVAVGAEVGTLSQVHLAKRSLTQLPLQHDVLPLDVLDTFPTKTKGFDSLPQIMQGAV